MPALNHQRQELFAQHLAAGKSQIEGYELAGYSPSTAGASRLAKHPAVLARIKELLAARAEQAKAATTIAAERAGVTLESLINEAEEIRQGAMEDHQWGAAVAALKEKGILSGKRIERQERGQPGEFEGMGYDELVAEAKREAMELGFVSGHSATQH